MEGSHTVTGDGPEWILLRQNIWDARLRSLSCEWPQNLGRLSKYRQTEVSLLALRALVGLSMAGLTAVDDVCWHASSGRHKS